MKFSICQTYLEKDEEVFEGSSPPLQKKHRKRSHARHFWMSLLFTPLIFERSPYLVFENVCFR
jgi:hypothetical protein